MMKMNKKMKAAVLTAALCALFSAGSTLYAAGNNAEPAELDGDTVEYDTKTGIIKASGDVLMKKGAAMVTGVRAQYNSKSQEGIVTGNVIAVKENMRMTCDTVRTDGQNHMLATGSVHGTQEDKTFSGEQVDYYPDTQYVVIATGGVITSKDGTFTADHMEGWMNENHFKGIGNAHLVSPPKNLEAGGNQVDYYGQDQGKAVITGNAWAIQDNNTLKSNTLTLYLDNNGDAQVQQ